ncbi:hypothetical protein AALP_AA8G240000 [Arabis alpina]|uniref:Cyclin-dependent kinase inhibitor domain-containing protein n=1 Tax=Arabis alpina TaxID=50452 RepID=A0A087G920_ARAAL|nr:hypothetical protein AALP_AA8G240000 [Arabis alpina]
MGKFIRNSKINGSALMDVSSSSSPCPSSSPLGVLTRAQSLALQQRRPSSSSSIPTSPNPPSNRKQKQKSTTDCTGTGSYLQLRSRRLQKKPPIVLIRRRNRRKDTCGSRTNPNPQISGSIRGDESKSRSRSDSVSESKVKELNCEINQDTSFGENFFDLDASESFNRTTRESTPCSLVRKTEIITTPGSSTKVISDNSNRREERLVSNRHLPTTPEMDEFFSGAEEEQQKQFIEKYNFDPVNEQPLPGRYEWKKVDDD